MLLFSSIAKHTFISKARESKGHVLWTTSPKEYSTAKRSRGNLLGWKNWKDQLILMYSSFLRGYFGMICCHASNNCQG